MTSLLLHGICSSNCAHCIFHLLRLLALRLCWKRYIILTMKLTVKVLGGAGCEVGASESDTIEQIKEIVAQRLQVAVDHQTLLFEGRTLKDANLVKDYKLKEGSKINLIVKVAQNKDSCSSSLLSSKVKQKEETGHLNSHHKDIYSALRKYFQTEEEARRVSKAFEQALLRKLSYLSLDDMERLCYNWTHNKKIIF